MNDKLAYKTLKSKLPKGYRINELIKFNHPYWRIHLNALVNKQPEKSLLDVYRVILKAVSMGLSAKKELFQFLGLSERDEFIERELFGLRKEGLLDWDVDSWVVTEKGKSFINDTAILSVQESEVYQVLMDGVSGEIVSYSNNRIKLKRQGKTTRMAIQANEISGVISDSSVNLSETYRADNPGAYLIDYDTQNIGRPVECWGEYYLVEYVPSDDSSLQSHIEIREVNEKLTLINRLKEWYNSHYVDMLRNLSDSDRFSIPNDRQDEFFNSNKRSIELPNDQIVETLSIWETKERFIDALKTVQSRILIESPWIKRATLEYIPYFRNLLKTGKKLYILYGIEEYDQPDHHDKAMLELKGLRKDYSKQFKLIHLPSHFGDKGVNFTGSHKKLVIKDDDYYIVGSFNFLSFGKQVSDKVANEESTVIKQDVHRKWSRVTSEYQLRIE